MKKLKINDEIKSFSNHKGRWMRCINRRNPKDYIDIHIHSGSLPKTRHVILCNADFLGGTWDQPFGDGREQYDYYFLYYRNKWGMVIDDNHQPMMVIEGDFIGQHRDGEFIHVNGATNRITEKAKSMEEIWNKKK